MPAAGMGPFSLYLTRHGLSGHNLDTRCYMGRAPGSELTEAGRAQAQRLAERLAVLGAVRHVVASSLPRAAETARIVARHLELAAVHEDDALWELSKGEWEGRMPRDGVPPEVQAQLAADPLGFRYPGGESVADVQRRTLPALWRWTRRFGGASVLFVLHGDVIGALLQALVRFPPADLPRYLVRPCSLTQLMLAEGDCRMLRFNENAGGA